MNLLPNVASCAVVVLVVYLIYLLRQVHKTIPVVQDIVRAERCAPGYQPETNVGDIIKELVCEVESGDHPQTRIGRLFRTVEQLRDKVQTILDLFRDEIGHTS